MKLAQGGVITNPGLVFDREQGCEYVIPFATAERLGLAYIGRHRA